MRQLRADRLGAPIDVLRVVDVDEAALSPGEVRVECAAVGLNFLDISRCRGTYGPGSDLPVVPGAEAAGTVVERGPGVDGLTLGQRVVACPTVPRGSLGERVVVDAALVHPVPDDVDLTVAAAIPVTYQTAWFALRQAGLAAGDSVLVHAGAGGVGTATIQLATAWGATVIATAGGPAKVAVCREQGAHVAVDTRTERFADVVREVTGGDGVDVVIDPVGGPTFTDSLACLAFNGRIVPVGAASGPPPPVDPMALTAANVSVVGLSWGSAYPFRRPAEVAAAYDELFAGVGSTVRPVIDRVVGLDETPLALDDLEQRRTSGKLIVRPGGR